MSFSIKFQSSISKNYKKRKRNSCKRQYSRNGRVHAYRETDETNCIKDKKNWASQC